MANQAPTRPAVLRRLGPLEVLAWPALDDVGVDAVVTTRRGGCSGGAYESLNLALHVGDDPEAVRENRRRVADALDATSADLVFGDQVHGAAATVVTAHDAGRGTERADDAVGATDALVTVQPGLVLVTLVADCVPIVLVDPEARVLATVHAGWRGTAAGVVGSALAAMTGLGARHQHIVAGIGPAVAATRYVVGDEVASAMTARLGKRAAAVLSPEGPGRWRADLPAANRVQLLEAGVPEAAVHTAPFSTDEPRFFSDRTLRPCGRFGLLARLR